MVTAVGYSVVFFVLFMAQIFVFATKKGSVVYHIPMSSGMELIPGNQHMVHRSSANVVAVD